MTEWLKPRTIRRGDRVAIVSPSWGGPSVFPGIYHRGLDVIRDVLGLVPVEFPSATMDAAELAARPDARAADINDAFRDDRISAIFTSIGGDDSVRVLPHLEIDAILANPKLLIGFSDVTTLLASLAGKGLVTMHGPTVMAGLAQAPALGDVYVDHLRQLLLNDVQRYEYSAFSETSNGYPDWGDPATLGRTNAQTENPGWLWLQTAEAAHGRFWGGCVEVLEFIKGSAFWPAPEFFDDVILVLETSEEAPAPALVKRILRNYGLTSVLARIRGLMIGRPAGYTAAQSQELAEIVREVVIGEHGRDDMPIVLNVDVGHTDPQWLLPFGIRAEIAADTRKISLVEPIFA